jgi:hypothetical protein
MIDRKTLETLDRRSDLLLEIGQQMAMEEFCSRHEIEIPVINKEDHRNRDRLDGVQVFDMDCGVEAYVAPAHTK